VAAALVDADGAAFARFLATFGFVGGAAAGTSWDSSSH